MIDGLLLLKAYVINYKFIMSCDPDFLWAVTSMVICNLGDRWNVMCITGTMFF